MSSRDNDDPTASHAPLLASEAPTREAGETDQSPDLSVEHASGRFIWYLTFSAGISGLLFGYDTGVISSTLVSIGSDLSNRPLTTLDKSLVTSCTSLFALIASPLAGILADRLGRKKVILVADVLFTVGALIQAVTSEVWGMILGRSIVGLAVGSASLVTPLYISELAPSNARGRLVTILSLFITGGQVVAYIVGWLFSYVDGGWRWIVGLGTLPAALQLFIVIALPETPRWLMQAGFESKALAILTKVYQDNPDSAQIAKHILRGIQQEVEEEEEQLGSNKSPEGAVHLFTGVKQRAHNLFNIGRNRRALTIAIMLQTLQQLCGFNSLMYFSGTLFLFLAFSSPTLTSLSVALTNFLFTLLAFAYIDRIGRRRILLYSIPVMVISLFVCALTFSSVKLASISPEPEARDATTNNPVLPLVILLCLTVYTAAYAFGLGNVPWQQSELFPLNVRSLGSALATATNWGSNFVVGLTFLPMMELLSPSFVFALYGVVCIVGWFGVRAIYPELSGLNLEDVKSLLADGWGVRESLARARSRSSRDTVYE
ncbi:general substrate transporter [Aspergillus karnatakaensis]|uniref:putative MFS myo-inositol transporter n=1 Tax=Aspergillus karnatakaensis TaxID=1810916 RepID=UPI003CCDFA5F